MISFRRVSLFEKIDLPILKLESFIKVLLKVRRNLYDKLFETPKNAEQFQNEMFSIISMAKPNNQEPQTSSAWIARCLDVLENVSGRIHGEGRPASSSPSTSPSSVKPSPAAPPTPVRAAASVASAVVGGVPTVAGRRRTVPVVTASSAAPAVSLVHPRGTCNYKLGWSHLTLFCTVFASTVRPYR